MAIDIRARVKRLVKEYSTRNPETLIRALDIKLEKDELTPLTRGYFVSIIRNKLIVVNSIYDELIQRIIMAHELGHALLHYQQDICFIKEYTLFPTGVYEVEANKFAAELLIDDCEEEIFLERGIIEASSYLGVPPKLIEYKFWR